MIYNSLSKETIIKIIEDQNIKIESQKNELEEKDKIINEISISLKITPVSISPISPVSPISISPVSPVSPVSISPVSPISISPVSPVSPVSISPISINNWRLQAWGGNANGKSQAENKRNIMDIFCKKKIHLIDLIKVDKNNKAVGINNNRNNQMKRINEGDKVYMCDNINYYYEGFIKENYKHYENDRLIKENRDIIDIVWGVSHWKWQNNLPKLKRIYISHIDWVKKPLTKEMELYLVKSIKNGGGRIDVQGTVLKLNNLIVK